MAFSGSGGGGGGGGVIRGHLRPGFSGRSPSFLMIGLLVIAAISAFNYWNLSSQYGDLVKEIAELQDHVRIATLKRENAEKHIDTLQQRLKDTEDSLGRTKLAAEAKTSKLASTLKEIEEKNDEILTLKRLTSELQVSNKLQNASIEESRQLQRQLESTKMENGNLKEKNLVLEATLADLKEKLAKWPPYGYQAPPIRPAPGSKTVIDANVNATGVTADTEVVNDTVKNTSIGDVEVKDDNDNGLNSVQGEADNGKEKFNTGRFGVEMPAEDYEAKPSSAVNKNIKFEVNVGHDAVEAAVAKEVTDVTTPAPPPPPIGNEVPRFNFADGALKES